MTQPQVVVGTSQSRVDRRLKVTGAATYAADQLIDGVAYAVIVDSTVGLGRITGVNTEEALAHPGVLQVFSHVNAPRLACRDNEGSNNPPGSRLRVFQDDSVLFFGQPVAVVVADTLEAAQHGARLVADVVATPLTRATREALLGREVGVAEVVVAPRSGLVGQRVFPGQV